MALEQVRLSDKSRETIEPGTGARVRVMFYAADTPDMRADLTDAEVAELISEYKLSEVDTRSSRKGEKRTR